MTASLATTVLLLGLVPPAIAGPAPRAVPPGDASGSSLRFRGVDVSSLPRGERLGARFIDREGRPRDALAILRDHGVNAIRLRVWVDPANGVNGVDDAVVMARRARALGLELLIDFHYSDHWADPGRQDKPAAWAAHPFEQLKQDVYDHTFSVCQALVDAGAAPKLVQVGNEINDGLLWPDGRASQSLDRAAQLVARGAAAVKAASPATLVMVHVAGGNAQAIRWLLDGLSARGVSWDVTGLSHYSFWHGTPAALRNDLADLAARCARPVIVAETGYPFTLDEADAHANLIGSAGQLAPGYPATPRGQADNLGDVMRAVRDVPNGQGWGVFYWEGAWLAIAGNGWDPEDPKSGNAWENQALFGFDGRVLPALERFRR